MSRRDWLFKQEGIVVRLYTWLVLHWDGGEWSRGRVCRGAGMSVKSMYRARGILLRGGLLVKDGLNWAVVNIFGDGKVD